MARWKVILLSVVLITLLVSVVYTQTLKVDMEGSLVGYKELKPKSGGMDTKYLLIIKESSLNKNISVVITADNFRQIDSLRPRVMEFYDCTLKDLLRGENGGYFRCLAIILTKKFMSTKK